LSENPEYLSSLRQETLAYVGFFLFPKKTGTIRSAAELKESVTGIIPRAAG